MDARYAFLLTFGVASIWASTVAQEGYSEAWVLIGIVSLVVAVVIWFRNRRRGPGKHLRGR